MATYVQNMIDTVLGDGARAAKFEVALMFPNNNLFSDDQAFNVLIKGAQFPGKSHDTIDLKYKGRSIPIKGQTKYNQTWECTFYLTEDHMLKNAFEIWIEALDQKNNYHQDLSKIQGLSTTQSVHSKNGYTSSATLYQRNFDDDQNTAEYNLYNVYPTEISNIQYSAETIGQIQEFTVTFAYSHYKMSVHKDSTTKAFIDELIDKGLSTVGNAINSGIAEAQGLVSNLAKDAIGAGKSMLEGAADSVGFDYESKLDELKQWVATPDDMAETLDTIQKSGKGISLDLTKTASNLSDSAIQAIKDKLV